MRAILSTLIFLLQLAGVWLGFAIDWRIGVAFACLGMASTLESLLQLHLRHPEATENVLIFGAALMNELRKDIQERRAERQRQRGDTE